MKLSPAFLLLALQPSLESKALSFKFMQFGPVVRGGGSKGNATEEVALPPPNSPPSNKHAHHKAGGFVSRIAENGLTNAGCCVADGIDSASARMADATEKSSKNVGNALVDAAEKSSKNVGNALVDAAEKSSKNVANALVLGCGIIGCSSIVCCCILKN